MDPENQNLYAEDLARYLEHHELEMLFTHSKVVTFSVEEAILQQGKKSEVIYFILKGNARVIAKILGEGTVNLGMLGPGSFLGEISFIEKIPCAASVIASEQVECLLITKNYIELISNYFPETKYKLFNAIATQVCARLKKMYDSNIALISSVNMSTKSLFGEMIHSLVVPSKITMDEAGIDVEELSKKSLFCLFTKQEITKLLKQATFLKAAKNCTLIDKNEKDSLCYIVIHGAVQSNIEYENKIAKLSIIGPQILFANLLCIEARSSSAITFTTCEKVILLKLSESDLNFFKKNHPSIWYKLFDLICRSLVALEKSIDKLHIRLKIESYNR